jgi:hypothetical protein
MKSRLVLAMSLFLTFAACQRGEDRTSAAPERDRNTTATRPDDTINQQRDQYVDTMKAKLDEMGQKIDGLNQRADAMKGTAKTTFDNDIKMLRDQKDAVDDKLGDLKDVSVQSWTSMRSDVEAAFARLEQSYQTVSQKHQPAR